MPKVPTKRHIFEGAEPDRVAIRAYLSASEYRELKELVGHGMMTRLYTVVTKQLLNLIRRDRAHGLGMIMMGKFKIVYTDSSDEGANQGWPSKFGV